MAGIGGIEWGYCGECCKEVPVIKAAKGNMLEEHWVMANDEWERVASFKCAGSLGEPGTAPAADVERVAFSSGPEAPHFEPEPTYTLPRWPGAHHEAAEGCGCPMRGAMHADNCASLTTSPEEDRARGALSRVEPNRAEWARMLRDGITRASEAADDATAAVRQATAGVARAQCIAMRPHSAADCPRGGADCTNVLTDAQRRHLDAIRCAVEEWSARAAEAPTLEATFPNRDTTEFRAGPSAALEIRDEMPSASWCSCEGGDHLETCPIFGDFPDGGDAVPPTHYVVQQIDEEFTLSGETLQQIADALRQVQTTTRESFVLHTTTADAEPPREPMRVEVNGVEVPGITSIEIGG